MTIPFWLLMLRLWPDLRKDFLIVKCPFLKRKGIRLRFEENMSRKFSKCKSNIKNLDDEA